MLHQELYDLYRSKNFQYKQRNIDPIDIHPNKDGIISKILFFIYLIKNDLLPLKNSKIIISKNLKKGYESYLDVKDAPDGDLKEVPFLEEIESYLNDALQKFTDFHPNINLEFNHKSNFPHEFNYTINYHRRIEDDPYFYLNIIKIINNYKNNGSDIIDETESFLNKVYFDDFRRRRRDGKEASLSDFNKTKITPHYIDLKKFKNKNKITTIYNPFSGLGSYGIAFINELGIKNIKIVNEDIDSNLKDVAILRYLIHFNSIENVEFNYGPKFNIWRYSISDNIKIKDGRINVEIAFRKRHNIRYSLIVTDPPLGNFNPHKTNKLLTLLDHFVNISDYTILSTSYKINSVRNFKKYPSLSCIQKIVCVSGDEELSGFRRKQISTYILNSKLNIVSTKNYKFPLTFITPNVYDSGGLKLDFKESIKTLNSKKQLFVDYNDILKPLFNPELIYYQSSLNGIKYRKIDDLIAEFNDDDQEKINYKNLSPKKITNLNNLPFVSRKDLLTNRFDFYTIRLNYGDNIALPFPLENKKKLFHKGSLRLVKCSCILFSLSGTQFGYIDINKYPNGVLISSQIIPFKVKTNSDPQFIVSSIFEKSFIDQLDIVKKDRILFTKTLWSSLMIYYEENAKARKDIIERNTRNEITNFLSNRKVKKFRGYEIKESIDFQTGKSIFYKDGIPVDNESYKSSNKYNANTDDSTLPTQLPEDMYDQLDIDIDKLSENDIKKNAISVSKIKDFIKKTKGEEKKKESQEQQIREGIIEELSRFTGQYAHKLKNYLKPIASNSLSLTEIVKKFKSKIEKNQFERIIQNIENIDEALDKTRNTINKFDEAVISTIRNKDLPLKDISHIKLMEIIDQNLDRFNDVEYINNFKVIENDYKIMSNKNYLENIFQNISDNAKKHSGSSKINLNGEIVMLKKEKFWNHLKENIIRSTYDFIYNKFLDNPYLLIEIEFNGARIPIDVNYNVFTKFGGSYGQSSNTGIGGFKIKEGIINSGGFFYYKHFEDKNYFKIYIPLKENDEIVSKSNLEKLSMILWR